MPPVSSSASSWFDQLLIAIAQASTDAARSALDAVFASFGQSTEPDLTAIVPVYDRMLALSLLIVGAVIAFGLMEGVLGGSKGLSLNVLTRTVAGVFIACMGLEMVQYASTYAGLLATTWTPDLLGLSHQLAAYNPQVHLDAHGHYPLGSALGLLITALFTVFMALVILLELTVRLALILLVTAFVPFAAVLAIWPRTSEAIVHLAEFLLGLLLSKFVVATAVYLGFALVLPPLLAQSGERWMVAGVAILLIAALSPVVLLNALRFSHGTASAVARDWGTTGLRSSPIRRAVAAPERLLRRALSTSRHRLQSKRSKSS